jgi:hypothetical protein
LSSSIGRNYDGLQTMFALATRTASNDTSDEFDEVSYLTAGGAVAKKRGEGSYG